MQYPRTFGAYYTKNETVFTLWAPKCVSVELRLYKAGSAEEAPYSCARCVMTCDEDNVFTCTVKGDLHRTYYDFLLTDTDGNTCESADPWAVACGVNGQRSMVVDLRSTDPIDWKSDRRPLFDRAPVIWETHVRDFSASPRSGVRKEWQGKYMAFTQAGTTLDNEGEYSTCLDYLKKLGVTHVQLQPIADYFTVDEARNAGYNWGYDIENYNVP